MLRIGIAGGGIAGTAAALFLSRAGHRVELFERAPVLGPVGAGFLLQPSGQRVLAGLGLLDRIVAASEPIHELHAEQLSGRTLIRIPYADGARSSPSEPPPPRPLGYGVARGLLFSTLLDAARAGGAAIASGHAIELEELRSEGSFLVASDGTHHGPYDFVIAADGGRSTLRESSALHCRRHDSLVGALWTLGPCTSVRGYLYQAVESTRHLIGLLPLGNGRASFFWGTTAAGLAELRENGFAAFRDRVVKMVPRSAEIFEEFTAFEQATFATYTHIRAPRWTGDRLVLMGDAAHSMSPHLGQGANLALGDAESFARHLAATGSFAAAAPLYEKERQRAAIAYSRLSWFLTPFFQSNSRILGWGRDVALPILSATPPIRRLMARTLAGELGAATHPRER
ncbi:MAG: NAD(P)/FAD-dependent oxidoreductase [Thermoanaerobaculia bacterium]